MGRDNHPRIRQARSFARKRASRAPYERILIVSEGSKTEPLYFDAIRSKYRLHTANVKVIPSGFGTLPRQVAEYALAFFNSNKDYDQIFIVFDRDDHRRYHEAFDLIEANQGRLKNSDKKIVKITPIVSIPCFELWLLLHFEDIHALMHRDEVSECLKSYLTGYTKGGEDSYQRTEGLIETAIDRSRKMCAGRNPRDDTQPYTNVHELIQVLYGFANITVRTI